MALTAEEQDRGDLQAATMQWRTPSDDSKRGGAANPDDRLAQGHTVNLQDQASFWKTPTSAPWDQQGQGGENEKQAKAWPSPTSIDHRPPHPSESGQARLRYEAGTWATPTSRDHKGGADPSEKVATNSLLGRQAPRTPMPGRNSLNASPDSHQQSQVLNPAFVEWLQGFPREWTDLRPLEMRSYQQWRQRHGGI